MQSFVNFYKSFIDDETGQGITEYGAVLAFLTVLIAMVFGFGSGSLKGALSESFSSINSQLTRLNNGVT